MKTKILCLSRAPLDFKGGIPKYCLNLYKNSEFNVKVFSYDIGRKISKRLLRNFDGIQETVFSSQLTFGTLAISYGYLREVLMASFKYDVIHIQHPDPISSIAIILLKIVNKKVNILTTWHAEIYKIYKIFSPILLFIDLLLFSISNKIIYFTPFHIKTSILAKFNLFKNKIKIIDFSIQKPKISSQKLKERRSINIVQKKNLFIKRWETC